MRFKNVRPIPGGNSVEAVMEMKELLIAFSGSLEDEQLFEASLRAHVEALVHKLKVSVTGVRLLESWTPTIQKPLHSVPLSNNHGPPGHIRPDTENSY